MARRDTRRAAIRIAAREEAARIAGHRGLSRSRDQQGAAQRSQPLEPDNLARKMKREPQLFQQMRSGWRTYSQTYARKGRDCCLDTSASLTGDFLKSTKLGQRLAHQLNHSILG
jgi:hypothetical protein